jgi:hypothetical protein
MIRFLPFLALLIGIGLFFGYIDPTYKGPITEAKTRIKNLDSALAAADRFKQKEAQLTAARNEISPESLKRLDSFLPDGVDNVQLILDLDALAARSGMRLGNFNTSMPFDTSNQPGTIALANENPVESLDLTMTGTGTYAAMRTFLAGIESSLRPLDVTDLRVSATETGVYTYGISIRLHWLR